MGDEGRKELSKKKKEDLVEMLLKSEELEARFEDKIKNLYIFIGEKLDVKRDFEARLIEVERGISLNNQYERRDTVEIVGVPTDVPQKDLENKVIDIFSVAGVQVSSSDFQAVHRLNGKNKNTVIAKLTNRKHAQSVKYNRKSLRMLSGENSTRLNVGADAKIYINDSLCGPFLFLMGLCNTMFKKKLLAGFWTVNGCIKIKLNDDDKGEGAVVGVTHIADLFYLFGREVVDGLVRKK